MAKIILFNIACSLAFLFCIQHITATRIVDESRKFTRNDFEFAGSVGGKAYFWLPGLNVTWIDSVDICHQAGLYIASIENEEEQKFLETTGARLNWRQYLNIAGTDLFSEGKWRWMRSGNSLEYTNWYPGSPYPEEEGGRTWNCLGLDPSSGYKWVDIWCNVYEVLTLCEYP